MKPPSINQMINSNDRFDYSTVRLGRTDAIRRQNKRFNPLGDKDITERLKSLKSTIQSKKGISGHEVKPIAPRTL